MKKRYFDLNKYLKDVKIAINQLLQDC